MINLTPIVLDLALCASILDGIAASNKLSNGESAELGRCIAILKNIWEAIDAYETSRPRLIRPTNSPEEN